MKCEEGDDKKSELSVERRQLGNPEAYGEDIREDSRTEEHGEAAIILCILEKDGFVH